MIPEKEEEEEAAETAACRVSFVSRHFSYLSSSSSPTKPPPSDFPGPTVCLGPPVQTLLLLLRLPLSRLLPSLLASPGNREFIKRWQWIAVGKPAKRTDILVAYVQEKKERKRKKGKKAEEGALAEKGGGGR